MTLISEAVVTLKKLSDDELFRLRYQAREDQLRQQWDITTIPNLLKWKNNIVKIFAL